ncbi:uncharacterized protein M6B38_120875 [Iris pallida]|uniref:Reverse transcriptase domain-containing protein n=1 Tax=Iris pallida TaxID=29817 RepID=A0AAX6H8X7_IRIPA|nr:uncharacterized protein M6B38_120875 [Iris pallida]
MGPHQGDDKLDWQYLMWIIRSFGFSNLWVELVFHSICNVWFSTIINGKATGFFRSSRGLKQDDPLSPALYIIVAEASSRNLQQVGSKVQNAYSTHSGYPAITHHGYTDDILVFCSGHKRAVRAIMGVLQDFKRVSGLEFSLSKSSVINGPSFLLAKRRSLTQITGFPTQ